MTRNNLKILSIVWVTGVFFVSMTYLLLHKYLIFYNLIFWSGIILSGLSTYMIISNDYSDRVKLSILFLFGFVLYIPRVLSSPEYFHTYDDLIHYQLATLMYETGSIGSQTNFLIANYYPTLEIVTVIFKDMTGDTIFMSGIIMVGFAHSFLAIFLYLFFINICSESSEKIASFGAFAYFLNSSYIQFDTYFSYESIGLPLLIGCLFAISLNTTNKYIYEKNDDKITFIQVMMIVGVTISHHFSSYVLLLFMIVLLISKKMIKEYNYKRVKIITLLTFLIIFAWTMFSAKIILEYYYGMIATALKGILTLTMFSDRVSEVLTNQISDVPFYELFIRRFIYIPLISILIFGGIGYLYKKKKIYNGYILTLIIFCMLFFVSLIGMMTSSFAIGRFFTYGFIGTAFILGLCIEKIDRIKMSLLYFRSAKFGISRISMPFLALVIISLLLIGGVSMGTVPPFRGSYSNNSKIGQESITTDLVRSALWSEKYLGRGNTFISDTVSGAAFEHYGFQKASTYSAWEVFFPSDMNRSVLDHLDIYVIKYLAVDRRITRSTSDLGYYFDKEELYIKDHSKYGRDEPMPIESIQKFDNSSTFYRMYDNGNINIFKIYL